MHLAEPGCAVTAADPERYEHYVKFLAEIKVGSRTELVARG
jgi:putative ribosome biogenesis GTPase RsgA